MRRSHRSDIKKNVAIRVGCRDMPMTEQLIEAEHIRFMSAALAEAELAAVQGDVPVGAVIVRNGAIIASAHNCRERDKSPAAHAEIAAITEAASIIGGWRLDGCTLYVTLEPCLMCAGAVVNARIPKVVFGCRDAKAGAMGSVINVASYPLNHKPEIIGDVLADKCAAVLRNFFKEKR